MRRRSKQGILEHVIDLSLAIGIDILIVDVPFRIAEIGSIGEAYGGSEHVTYGSDGAFREGDHAIEFGGDVTREVKVHEVAEPWYGVHYQAAVHGIPTAFDMLKIHVVVERGGVGPGEVLEQLDGQVDGDGVLDAALCVLLEILEPS